MRKYKKLFRYLFTKYANSCYSKKIIEFDALKEKFELITIAEVTKMLNDNNIKSNMLSREALATIMRLINVKTQRNDISTMTYDGFQECFMQLSIYIYSKPPIVLSHLPLVESVKALVLNFQEATSSRGESTILYTEPDATSLGDQDLLKELNKIVKTNADYPVPEGYRKVTDREISFVHQIQGKVSAYVKESMRISVEIIDALMESMFPGSHILESSVRYHIKTKVYPDIVKPQKQLMPVKYMDKIEKKTKDKSPELKRQSESFSLVHIKKIDEVRKKLPISMKMEIAKLPKDLRFYGQDVGEILEEILEAVEEGRTELVKKKGNRIINPVVKSKIEFEEELRKIRSEKEAKRKSRHQMLKQKLDKIAKETQADEQKKKTEEEIEAVKLKEKQEKIKEDKKKEREELKRRIKEIKEKKEAEAKKNEEDSKKRQRRGRKKGQIQGGIFQKKERGNSKRK